MFALEAIEERPPSPETDIRGIVRKDDGVDYGLICVTTDDRDAREICHFRKFCAGVRLYRGLLCFDNVGITPGRLIDGIFQRHMFYKRFGWDEFQLCSFRQTKHLDE